MTIQDIVDVGLSVFFVKVDDSPLYKEPGPYRIKICKYLRTSGDSEIIISGITMEEALADLSKLTYQDLCILKYLGK